MTVVLADVELRRRLGTHQGITVVAEASTAAEVLRETVRRRPEVVIFDLDLGVALIEEVLRSAHGTAVLACSSSEEAGWVSAALRAGARGYVTKGADRGDIIRAIYGVAAGEMIFGAHVAPKIARLLSMGPGAAHPFGNLTEREREVLDLIAAGLQSSTIANRLRLAPKTIRNNISTIVSKLHATNRAEAIARARAAGLGKPRHNSQRTLPNVASVTRTVTRHNATYP